MKEESEFGKGLVICLVKFAEHRQWWYEQKELYKGMHQRHVVELHMNGASDHLFGIEVPEKWKRTKLGKMVVKLQEYGLAMGHGFLRENWTEEDVERAYSMCHEIALLIDKELGLKPEIGRWP